MAAGKSWKLTDKRLAYTLTQLEKQMSVSSIALHFKIDQDTLLRKLREAGIDHKAVKRSGIDKLRKNCLGWLHDIDDPKDKVGAALKYLSKYDDTQVSDSTAVTVDVSSEGYG